jgi:hypothetical protein
MGQHISSYTSCYHILNVIKFSKQAGGIQTIPNHLPLLQIIIYMKGFGFFCVRFVESFIAVQSFFSKISQRSYV